MTDLDVKKTLVEMLRDRKYVFPNHFDPQAAIDKLAKQEDVMIPFANQEVTDSNDLVTDDRGGFVYVLILEDDQGFYKSNDRDFTVREASKRLRKVFPDLGITKNMEDLTEFVHFIVIYNATKNNKGGYDTSKYEAGSLDVFNLEIWPKHMLRFNVTHHSLVPQHILMTQDEVQAHLNEFNLTPSGCQKIMINDLPIRYYYGQPKQMFKITRVGQDITYRMVIKVNLATFKPKPSR